MLSKVGLESPHTLFHTISGPVLVVWSRALRHGLCVLTLAPRSFEESTACSHELGQSSIRGSAPCKAIGQRHFLGSFMETTRLSSYPNRLPGHDGEMAGLKEREHLGALKSTRGRSAPFASLLDGATSSSWHYG